MGGVFLLVFVLVFFGKDKISNFFKGNTSSAATTNNNSNTATVRVPSAAEATDDTMLQRDSPYSDKVRELQLLINRNKDKQMMPNDLVVDGLFGQKTEQYLILLTGKKSISINQFKQLLKA